jgi:hypothetical protein
VIERLGIKRRNRSRNYVNGKCWEAVWSHYRCSHRSICTLRTPSADGQLGCPPFTSLTLSAADIFVLICL